jgi:hypothetical protein
MGGALSRMVGFSAAAGGASPYYGTVESLSGAAATNTTYADKITTSPTLVSGRKYLLIWSADAQFGGAADGSLQLTVNGSSVDEQIIRPVRSTTIIDKLQFGGFAFYTATGTDGPFAVQAKTASGTITLSNLRITYLALDATHDYTTESLTRQTTTSTSFQTAATHTFSDTGSYVALVSFDLDGSNNDIRFEVSDGTTTISELVPAATTSTRRYPIVCLIDMGSVSGSKSITVKYRSGLGATTGISNIRVLTIRLNRYANSYKTTLAADSSGTETTYTTALTQTFTPAAASHLAIAAWGIGSNSATQSNYTRLSDGGTVVGENIAESQSTTVAGRWLSGFTHQLTSYAASSRTQAIERHGETTNQAAVVAKAMILTLDLTGLS